MDKNEIEEGAKGVKFEEPTLHHPVEVDAILLARHPETPTVILSGTEVVALLGAVLGA